MNSIAKIRVKKSSKKVYIKKFIYYFISYFSIFLLSTKYTLKVYIRPAKPDAVILIMKSAM